MILATRPLGEADLLVVLLTPTGGKLRAAARNARRSRRRFAGGLPGGAVGEATLTPGRQGGLWRLESFGLLRDPAVLGRDLDRFAYVAYVCELTDALVHEPEADPRLFAALVTTIDRILARGAEPAALRRYELQLLHALGHAPAFDACCVCGTPVDVGSNPVDPAAPERPAMSFDGQRGGVLCPAHARGAHPLPAAVIGITRALLEVEETAVEATVEQLCAAPREVRRAVRDLTTSLLRPHLRRPLRSLEFLSKLGASEER